MCVAAGYDVVSESSSDVSAWCFDGADAAGDALGAASSTRSSSSKTAENRARTSSSRRKKKSTRDGSTMAEAEAEEFAKLQGWMSRVYVAVGVGAVARVAYKVWDRRRAESGSGAARRARASRRRKQEQKSRVRVPGEDVVTVRFFFFVRARDV